MLKNCYHCKVHKICKFISRKPDIFSTPIFSSVNPAYSSLNASYRQSVPHLTNVSNVLSARGPIAEMRLVVLITLVTVDIVVGLMVMDKDSCHRVEEQNCGLCHTIYIQQCGLKMVEEMLPTKVNICRNVTRYNIYNNH